MAVPETHETDPDETLAILKNIDPHTVILVVRRAGLTIEQEEEYLDGSNKGGYSLLLLSELEWAKVTANGKAPDTASSVKTTVRKLVKLLSAGA
jgi:hypothetical protein